MNEANRALFERAADLLGGATGVGLAFGARQALLGIAAAMARGGER